MQPELSVVGIALAKSLSHLVGPDERGTIIVRKRLARGEVLPCMAQLPRVLVGMEACGGAHYWARRLREQGHEVKLMAPQYVKPYVKTNKNHIPADLVVDRWASGGERGLHRHFLFRQDVWMMLRG